MSGLEADMAVDDTCSPSRNYVWVCIIPIILMHKQLGISPSFIILFPSSQLWIVARCWRIWKAGRGNWELADHQGCIMSRYHVYSSFGNPDCLEYPRFIHHHMYHLPNFDWSYSSTRRYIPNSKVHFSTSRHHAKIYMNPRRVLFFSTHCYQENISDNNVEVGACFDDLKTAIIIGTWYSTTL